MAPDATRPARRPFPTRSIAVLGVVVGLVVVALAGPRARVEPGWTEPELGPDVDAYLADREKTVPALREGEAASVVWARPEARGRTRVALVYLHGFSADRHEVEPLVSGLARELGANAYFARLRGHGRDGPAMAEATAEDWLEDAAEAVAIGARIGERVVLVGTSTGATLALWAAAQEQANGRLAALVLISPNLGLRNASARLLRWPWGGLLARLALGPERCFDPASPDQEAHWTVCYPTRALLPMMAIVGLVTSMDLGRVTVPTLVLYSRDDAVVDPTETERRVAALGADVALHEVLGSGDPERHVIAGAIMSPETTDQARGRVLDFLEGLGMR